MLSHHVSSTCICVVGWHFPTSVFAQLTRLDGVKIFILSHRPVTEIPPEVVKLVGMENIHAKPNLGYDWGAYQQFLELGIYRNYSTVIFMHDDVAIHDLGFVVACQDLLLQGHTIVGNGRNSERVNWFQSMSPAVYAHSVWLPADSSFKHLTVRGSFWATTAKALERLGSLEVFWDRFQLSDGFGNHSLIATCGKAESLFGEKCFAFLGETYLSSRFITESVRGGTNARKEQRKLWLVAALGLYRRAGTRLVFARMKQNLFLSQMLQPLVSMLASRRTSVFFA